jgi:alkylglycerol monooxygenase
MNLLVLAMPAFFLFLYLEYSIAKAKKLMIYKYESSISNISVGIAERLLDLFIAASFYKLFEYIYNKFALFDIPANWLVWVGLLLSADFVWYWYHRLGHEVNLFWGAHIVHHQSEEFNYTVSARITTIQALVRNVFWCILPLAGFHPDMVITILLVHGSYSFFTHTQVISKVKWLEYILITPSLHGVHHASNDKYLDKNYGDVFVFWDKIFGTFQQEDEKPVYGLTHPLKSRSFLWQHFHYYLEIAESCKRADGFGNKMRTIFGSPANMDQDIRPFLERKFLQDKSTDKDTKTKFTGYLNLQIAFCIVLLCWFTISFDQLNLYDKSCSVLIILITLINCGALLEQRKWIYYLEYLRIFTVLIWISIAISSIEFLLFCVITAFILESLLPLQRWYTQYVLKMNDDQQHFSQGR